MRRAPLRFLYFLFFLNLIYCLGACHQRPQTKITIGSKFFTEQVILAELLAQHIEAKTGIPVIRKTNLGGTLLVHKALLAGELDLYVQYTGTALTAVPNQPPPAHSNPLYHRAALRPQRRPPRPPSPATTSRPTTPSPSFASPRSPYSPSFAPRWRNSPANSPPPTSAASTTPSTPSTRMPPPSSVSSVLLKASSAVSPE